MNEFDEDRLNSMSTIELSEVDIGVEYAIVISTNVGSLEIFIRRCYQIYFSCSLPNCNTEELLPT